MPGKSTIKTLPRAILDEVNRLLADDLATIDEVVAHLAELGHARSRSAVGRYKQDIGKVADKLRRSREIAGALVREIGPAAAEGKTGRLLVEVLQSIAFDYLMQQAEKDDAGTAMDSQDFFFLGKALKEMASAQKIDVDRELKIREQVAKQLLNKVEAASGEAEKAGERGLSAARIAQLREDFLGVRPKASR